MLLWVIRAFFLLIVMGTAARMVVDYGDVLGLEHGAWASWLLFAGIFGIGLLAVVLDVMYREKSINNISAVCFGVLLGSILAHFLSLTFGPTLEMWTRLNTVQADFSLVATLILSYLCVSILLQTKNDFRFIIPYIEFSRHLKGGQPLILDTSVIIDGRIADIVETGLLDQTLVVPRFVLSELQGIADSSDKTRRNRGRRGLNMLDRLKQCEYVDVEMHDDESISSSKARNNDQKLILFAKKLNGKVLSNDINLGKMAKFEGVEVVNINAVSNATKPPVMHGEHLVVRLVKEGEGPGQGIGYLEDGTMVVAEMGKNFVGHDVNLIVTSVLQTNAGRMAFGKIDAKSA